MTSLKGFSPFRHKQSVQDKLLDYVKERKKTKKVRAEDCLTSE